MGQRAEASGIRLSTRDAATIKAMLARGDRQHDIAAWFGVNGGRIGEIASGKTYAEVYPEQGANIPPPGPYPNGRDATIALQALMVAKEAIDAAAVMVRQNQW
jgi:hypothetical protein